MFTKMASLILATTASTVAFGGQSFMPENDLHLQPSILATSMDQREFNRIIDEVSSVYKPLMKNEFGANLVVERAWNDRTVNAYAYQSGSNYYVKMFGGLARNVTSDGFMAVLCHELGHHLGGFPFTGSRAWAANDGQSDQFATQVCMRKVLAEDHDTNATFAKSVHPTAKKTCDKAWDDTDSRNLCYRLTVAGESLARLLSHGGRVSYDTPDRRVVSRTDMAHPPAQCRMDTYLAGAVCSTQTWDDSLIPGKGKSDRLGRSAEQESTNVGCHTANGDVLGSRPKCWFRSGL